MNASLQKKQAPAILRWLILITISLAMFANYYVYDSISPLADLLAKQLQFTDSNIGLLQAIYSIPNIFMVLIGGIIIDKIGTKRSSMIFALLVFLGALLTFLQGELWLMALGRLIFGLGAESMIVAITTIIARWFKNKENAFAFGLNLTIARLGSFLALNSPSWASSFYTNWQKPLILAAIIGFFTIVFLAIFYLIDKYAEKKYDLPQDGKQDEIILREVLTFNRSFWLITMLCIVFYAAMFPFQTFAVKFFQDAHGISRDAGGFLSSILTISAMIFTPLFGLLADKFGKRSLLLIVGSLIIIPPYLMMAYNFNIAGLLHLPEFITININFLDIHATEPTNLLIPMFLLGLAFSLVPAVLWPYVPIIVENNKLGTAYGLMTMMQNIGLSVFNLAIGFCNDCSHASLQNPNGYKPGMWLFSVCGIMGVIFAILLKKNEKQTQQIEKQN